MDEWDKENVVYIHTVGYYSVLKRKEILSHATLRMNLFEDIMLSEVSQSQKDKYVMIPLTWGTKQEWSNS